MNDLDKRGFDERHAAGLQTRREVIGAERTDRLMQQTTDFDRPLHDLLNVGCFNEVWNRPGLTRATRSLITVGMLCALNRGTELRTHLNAALNNGVTPDELQEVLLHAGVYCGVPAAVEGFRTARDVLRERGIERQS